MNTVVTLVEHGGSACSFHVDGNRIADIAAVLRANLSREAKLMTDEHQFYKDVGRDFASHESVTHSKDEYVRGEVHTNTVEGYYQARHEGRLSALRREAPPPLSFRIRLRYSNRVALGVHDGERADVGIKGAAGKRLT
jgi:hypothetical protein